MDSHGGLPFVGMETSALFLPRESLDRLLVAIRREGYRRVLGPVTRDGAITYASIASSDDLPKGLRDHQGPGHYRLEPEAGERRFAWANGPQALKPLTFAPRETLWRCELDDNGRLRFLDAESHPEPTAVIGVRA
ncbi:MAG: sulfite reductase subunit A, partial [Thioalkalivibrio sp.]|nr:sulfite reductase subunit A [Thioalkalivibrio sp.]